MNGTRTRGRLGALLILALMASVPTASAQTRNIERGADAMGRADALIFSQEASGWFCAFAGGCDQSTTQAMNDGERSLRLAAFGITRNDAYRWFPGCVIETLRKLGADAKKLAVFEAATDCFADRTREEWER